MITAWVTVMGFREKLRDAVRMVGFEDVYMVPGFARVEPYQVDLSTRFSRNVSLSIPISSSPMDTVSEWEMAVALALHGGIGVIHRNMSVEEQVEAVRRVKQHPPVRLRSFYVLPDEPCSRVYEMLKSTGVRQAPLIDYTGVFRGYVRLSELVECSKSSPAKPVAEIASSQGRGFSIQELEEARRIIIEGVMDCVAIVSSEGRLLGTLCLEEALEEYTPVLDDNGRLRVAAAISPFDEKRALALDDAGVDVLVSDVAHFHNRNVLSAASKLSKSVSADFIAGNIATYEAAVDTLARVEKVDGLRVGLGGGTICSTPMVAGAYVPTLWAVASVRDALEEYGASDTPVIADGGIRTPADGVKALAAGAWCLMLGYALAGTDEAPAPLVRIGDRAYKPYRGMASPGAMERRLAVDRYARTAKKVAEGVEGLVPYRGSVVRVLEEWVEALKAGLGYAGASSIRELWEKAKFGQARRKTFEGLVLQQP